MPDPTIIAVLTGDLIKSSSLKSSELEKVRKLLRGTFKDFDDAIKSKSETVIGRPEFFRGDSWQGALAKPEYALRISLILQAKLHHQGLANTRIAIAFGQPGKLNKRRISLSTGDAFVHSGKALDEMPRSTDLTINLSDETQPELARWLPVVSQLCSTLISHTTKRQAEILAFACLPTKPTQQEIAEEFDVARPTITIALDALGWPSIETALDTFESSKLAESPKM